jgi:hypothetical protein
LSAPAVKNVPEAHLNVILKIIKISADGVEEYEIFAFTG